MPVKSIIDSAAGRRWDIFKLEENSYKYEYREMVNGSWWFIAEDGIFDKDAIEFVFEVALP